MGQSAAHSGRLATDQPERQNRGDEGSSRPVHPHADRVQCQESAGVMTPDPITASAMIRAACQLPHGTTVDINGGSHIH
jgi:hypothetical protein